jgi:hypothetical protein
MEERIMLNPAYGNVAFLRKNLANFKKLIQEKTPVLFLRTRITREFIIELDKFILDFCKNPPQTKQEFNRFIGRNMAKAGMEPKEAWNETASFCARLLGFLEKIAEDGCASKIAILGETIFYFRNMLALYIGAPIKPADYYTDVLSVNRN